MTLCVKLDEKHEKSTNSRGLLGSVSWDGEGVMDVTGFRTLMLLQKLTSQSSVKSRSWVFVQFSYNAEFSYSAFQG